MKTRGFGVGLWMALVAGAVVSAGCNSTTTAEREAVAPPAVLVTNVPAPDPVAAVTSAPPVVASVPTAPAAAATAEPAATPVQKSLRPNPDLPEDLGRVVQLVESGVGEEVVRAFVDSSSSRFDLSLEQIMYLRDIGISDGVIAAMMRRGSELRDKDAAAAATQTNLVAAVEQIKEGLAASGGSGGNTAAPEPAAAAAAPGQPAPAAGVAAAGAPAAPAPAPGTPAPVVVVQPTVPAEAPQPVQQFYTSLTPYGTWYQVPTYGWVWQPSVVVVDRTWMPYRHGGRWVWTDCGWYWCSDYSWGWAPFHYGRWTVYPGLGWCWTPDTVWGPSWVTWRQCDGYFGWAPLPPHCGWVHGVGLTWYGRGISVGFSFGLAPSCYTFVPGHRFGHRNLASHAVRGREHDGAFQQSTVINNVINGNNNVIVNNGVAYSQVAKVTRDEIPKARVQPLPSEANAALRADRLERARDGMVVYKPTEVKDVGGRPTLRSEVRPAVARGPEAAGQNLGMTPSRAVGASPRFTGGAAPSRAPVKAVETRGSEAAPGVATPGARPTAVNRPSAVSGTPVGATPSSGTPAGRGGMEARRPSAVGAPVSGVNGGGNTGAGSVPVAQPSAAPRREGAVGAAPNRFLPRGSGPATTPNAQPGSVGVPSRSLSEGRGTVSAPSAVAAPTAPLARPTPAARPGFQAPTSPERSSVVPSAPAAARPAYANPAPAMSVPARPTYSAPAPAVAAPSRPAYSAPAPAPAMSAPRPSYSAPAPAPAMSAPVARPAPVAAPAAPAAPVPSGGGGGNSRNGPRTQPN